MAPDDRDRNLDKALARHFRSSALDGAASVAQPVGAFAGASGGSAPALSACPDAEILAAYHDGSLSPEEFALWKAHVLACSDCQLILEHLGTPLDAPVALGTPAHILVAAQSAQLRAALPAIAVTSPAGNVAAPDSPAPLAPAAISIARPRKTYFRWLVPTGAIAAGLLAWAVIHESGVPKLGPADALRVETAENRPSTLPPSLSTDSAASPAKAEPQRVAPAASPSDNERKLSAQVDQLKQDLAKQAEQKEKDQSLSTAHGAGSAGAIAQQSRTDQQQLRDRLQSAEPRSYAAPSSGPRLSQQQQQQAQLTPHAADSGANILDKKAPSPSADLVAPREEPSFVEPGSIHPSPPQPKAAQAAPAPPPPPPSSAVSGAPVAAPPKPAAAAKSRASGDSVSALTQNVTVESTAPSGNLLRTASAAMRGPQVFNDPAHKSVWRVGPAGSVEFSADKGATFTPQSTGISADLFTGSAPAAKVCWIVGANGAILRTTDAGQHWLKLNAPLAADILGIHATDAFHATIWFVPDAKSSELQTYKTSDGALTWSLVPSN
jgi:hypothetical protein